MFCRQRPPTEGHPQGAHARGNKFSEVWQKVLGLLGAAPRPAAAGDASAAPPEAFRQAAAPASSSRVASALHQGSKADPPGPLEELEPLTHWRADRATAKPD